MKKYTRIIFALIFLVSAFSLCGCSKKNILNNQTVPVETITLKNINVLNSQVYQGVLISRNSVDLKPQISGQVSRILVKSGDKVQKGALLLVIDKNKEEAALNQIKSEIDSLKSAVSFNKGQYQRHKDLYEKGAVSKVDLEQYEDRYKKAKSDLAVNLAKTNVQNAQLQYYKIRAPFSGTIGDIPVKTGEHVNPETNLLNITQNAFLEVNVNVPSDKVFATKECLKQQILDDENNVISTASINFVSPIIDPSTQTLLTKAIADNASGVLKANQSVKVRILFNQKQGILTPTDAISHFGGVDFAFLIDRKGEKTFAKQVPVKLGNLQENSYVILSGLKEGDEIVSSGIQKLMNNAPVQIVNKEAK